MMDFKYCVWIIPKENHSWYNYTNGFIPHMTIKSKMNYSDALNLYNSLKNQNIQIKLDDKITYSVEKDFHGLYFLCYTNLNLAWWPKNAHVSFRYNYDKSFTPEEIKKVESEVLVKDAELFEIKLVKCSGHFKNWIIIK